MKFKIIFILFNIVIILSFLIVFFMPLFLLGWGYTKLFWQDMWYLPAIFVLVMGIINTYFIMNWKLFSFLEQEDWINVISYLEKQVYEKQKLKNLYIKILANAYLVRSDINGITKLEAMVRRYNMRLLKKHVLTLGIPSLLKDDPDELIEYFSEFTHDHQVKDRYWVRYLTAYGWLRKNEPDQAKEALLSVCKESSDPVLLLLTVYSLYPFVNGNDAVKDIEAIVEIEQCVKEKGRFLCTKYSKERFYLQVERNKHNLIAVILRKIIDEAVEWLFDEGRKEFSKKELS